ncbi:DNA repair ATPase [Hymenobacter arizonensis]|uniref:Holliday junction DNA helicase ruvB N-terminus n=1 Tax=Hymenobacter arizonensis TaxID=1227077 RepID=A0A1I5ZTH3_HYMAR|nr:DNA repair ATPase [Hymenobacter arizonensis]SFQ59748.1 Holliday junction DNA helicase ruvB N-terminus [Hymenobacter arizonensis]
MEPTTAPTPDVKLEGGTYEILRNRLQKSGADLRTRLAALNTERKAVFGAIDTKLIGTGRINTEHNCVPWDMVPVGRNFLFGYNVLLGLKTEVELSDVFGAYSYAEHEFHPLPLDLISNAQFTEEFRNLYKYYKNTQFVKFAQLGPHLFMVFRVGKSANDIKTFKWLLQGDTLTYLDNRSDHEYVFPPQHEFTWKRTTRDMQRSGKHPHISIEDKVFVETIHGDLTIKIENNTENGRGIYSEPVADKDQTLDDSEIYYAVVGNIILLKIRPYQEQDYRYFIYNAKLQTAQRLDALAEACVLLPDNQGLVFPHGFYLQTGEGKLFEKGLRDMLFEKRIVSPNGEDFLYVFFNKENGAYLLLSYNIIAQRVDNPISCHGYALFENGELCYFRKDDEPKKHHAVQIWQTPYVAPNFELPVTSDSYLYKLGNKEIVRAMSEAQEVLTLLGKDDSYAGLYLDLIRLTGTLTDTYHWLREPAAQALAVPLHDIQQAANAAVDEFDKVLSIRKSTGAETQRVLGKADELTGRIKRTTATDVNEFVQLLAELRGVRGEVISLKELRYVELPTVEKAAAELEQTSKEVAGQTVDFLLKDDALKPYAVRVQAITDAIEKVQKVAEANELEKQANAVSGELELLIEVVSNLPMEDPTQTTRIIDNISTIYASFNQIRAALKRRRQALAGTEAQAEFTAQIKLLDQALVNYLDLCDAPNKCDEYSTKLMVQLEELEGKFPEFDQFLNQLAGKREEVSEAFESRKVSLVEARNQRASALLQSAERILKAVQNRLGRFETVADINGYFASDMMVEKVRQTVQDLLNLGDPVKADDIQSRLKTVKEDAVRQLKDRAELFTDGGQALKFGPYAFTVNTQPLELTVVLRDGDLHYHLTGTNFFQKITDSAVLASRAVWDQTVVSENADVYRAEYLAWLILQAAQHPAPAQDGAPAVLSVAELSHLTVAELTAHVQQFMAPRYAEGYLKGVHDHDAALLLEALVRLTRTADLLRYATEARAAAALYWHGFTGRKKKAAWQHQLQGIGVLLQVFPDSREFEVLKAELQLAIEEFAAGTGLFQPAHLAEAGDYLFFELTRGETFVIAAEAAELLQLFQQSLKERNATAQYETSVALLAEQPAAQFQLVRQWLQSFLQQSPTVHLTEFRDECAVLLLTNSFVPARIIRTPLRETLAGFQGSHARIHERNCQLNFPEFRRRLHHYAHTVVPLFEAFGTLKKELLHGFTEELRLNEFRPRVLSSFVRNKLIDEVYLPLIGANLAKQIGTAGADKRTDLMGLLLLVSPPGYGKTTLMEYVANRLGLIFMKINGPAIGHAVTSVDPAQAPNSGAREELLKLNLAFEMGDNVMIYLDDIQHCNPEFLQKFISLCDAQRKIEGVYQGRARTYDFRGRKVAVVMAGNPYTESGEQFRIPDMLANRADIYNLGDIIGDTANIFLLSYLENALVANPVLNRLAAKSQADVYPLIKLAETGDSAGLTFEANHSPEEINEYVAVLQKLLRIRDVVARVNEEYIRSAAQANEYRTEPPFKLQGSYRNMAKLAEKVRPIMNDEEVRALLATHYDNEAQTLTSGTEANLLKLRELLGWLQETETTRWADIKATFTRNLRTSSGGQLQSVLTQLEHIASGLGGIKAVLEKE